MKDPEDPQPSLKEQIARFRKLKEEKAPVREIQSAFTSLVNSGLGALAQALATPFVSTKLRLIDRKSLAWEALTWFYFHVEEITPGSELAAIHGFIRRRAAFHWRIEQRLAFIPFDLFHDRAPDKAPPPKIDPQKRERLRAALETLSTKQRTIVILRVIYGLTFTEIGRSLGMPASTVRVYHGRAIARLRKILTR